MMPAALSAVPYVGIALFNMVVYTAMTVFAHEPEFTGRLAVFAVSHIGVVILCSLLYPFLFARLGREKPTFAILFLLVLVLLPVLAYAPGIAAWFGREQFGVVWFAAFGVLAVPSYSLLFNLVPRKRQGGGLACGFAAATIIWGLATLYLGDGDGFPHRLDHIRVLIRLATTALSACVIFGALSGRRNLLPPPPGPAHSAEEKTRLSSIALLLGAACLFFIMNGFLGARLFPFLAVKQSANFTVAHVLAIFVCPLMGWLIDKKGERAFRSIFFACSLFFIFAPSLVALDNHPRLYHAILTFASLGQMAIMTVMPLALARLMRNGKWFCLAYCSIYWLRGISLFGAWLVDTLKPVPEGYITLFSILAASIFYLLVKNVSLGEARADEPLSHDAAALTIPMPKPAPSATRATPPDFEQRLEACGLSPRETEIAVLLLRGMATRDIALSLGIAENTVRTHVRSILTKTQSPNQKAFLASFVGGNDSDSPPFKQQP